MLNTLGLHTLQPRPPVNWEIQSYWLLNGPQPQRHKNDRSLYVNHAGAELWSRHGCHRKTTNRLTAFSLCWQRCFYRTIKLQIFSVYQLLLTSEGDPECLKEANVCRLQRKTIKKMKIWLLEAKFSCSFRSISRLQVCFCCFLCCGGLRFNTQWITWERSQLWPSHGTSTLSFKEPEPFIYSLFTFQLKSVLCILVF